MKKTYIKPAMKSIKLRCEHLIAESIAITDEKKGGSYGLSNERDNTSSMIWGEDE